MSLTELEYEIKCSSHISVGMRQITFVIILLWPFQYFQQMVK